MTSEKFAVVCGICGLSCPLTECQVDEHGRAVHSRCHVLKMLALKDFPVTAPARHQCVIYDGVPSQNLSALADAARQKRSENYRCVFLNSPPMVAGIKRCLAARGIDVARELDQGSLQIFAERTHLVDGRFDVDRMIADIEAGIELALIDGYKGLWMTGDVSWEFGPQQDFSKIVEYEWRLEQVFQKKPGLSGVCQYFRGTLPPQVMREGLVSHQSIFLNETLSRLNPHCVFQALTKDAVKSPEDLDQIIAELCLLSASYELLGQPTLGSSESPN